MMEDRPAPSPQKLLGQFRDWTSGTELPGRTMSYLKTGGLPELLTHVSGVDGVDTMVEAWSGWETGTTNPTVVLEVLRDAGIETLLLGLVET